MWELIWTYPTISIILLVLALLFVISKIITRCSTPVEQISGDFTLSELNQFDGVQKPQTFVALKGVIFDVSGSWFYKKHGPYGMFAGHDASINLAQMDYNPKLLDQYPDFYINDK